MKTKRLYQSPLIRRDEVELEDGFCGSIMEGKANAVEIEGHTVGGDYNFADSDPDKDGTNNFDVTWE